MTIMTDDLFGGMFDFNGDGETDYCEEAFGMALIDELSHEEDDDIHVSVTIHAGYDDDDSETAELREEIQNAIDDLEDALLDMEDQEPDDLYSERHEQWEERVVELEEKISELEDKLVELEPED